MLHCKVSLEGDLVWTGGQHEHRHHLPITRFYTLDVLIRDELVRQGLSKSMSCPLGSFIQDKIGGLLKKRFVSLCGEEPGSFFAPRKLVLFDGYRIYHIFDSTKAGACSLIFGVGFLGMKFSMLAMPDKVSESLIMSRYNLDVFCRSIVDVGAGSTDKNITLLFKAKGLLPISRLMDKDFALYVFRKIGRLDMVEKVLAC